MEKQTKPKPLGAPMAKMILVVAIIVSLGVLFGAVGYLAKNKPVKTQQPQVSPISAPTNLLMEVLDSKSTPLINDPEIKLSNIKLNLPVNWKTEDESSLSVTLIKIDTKISAKMTIEKCEDSSDFSCFGSGRTNYTETVDGGIYDLLSTDRIIDFGLDLIKDDNHRLYRVSVDFGNHQYTEKEFDEMRKSLISAFSSIFIFIEDETADWQTYRNEEYGFEVKYPENWIYEQIFDNLNSEMIKFDSTEEAKKTCDEMGCGAWGIDLNIYNSLVNSLEHEISVHNGSKIIVIKQETIDIAGNQFIKLTFNDGSTKYLIEKNGTLLDFFSFNDIYRLKILVTLKFTEKDETMDWKTYRNEEYGFEFKYPKIFDPNKNLIIRDWTINSEAGPDEFYFKVSQARWKNRLAHKIGYKKGDSCIDPDDVAPITDYDSSKTNCIIYQLDNNYVIRYNDPDSVDYILVLDKGEIIYTFDKANDVLFDQIISTFKSIDDINILNQIKNSEHYSQAFKQTIQLEDGKYYYCDPNSVTELKIGICNNMIALSDLDDDGEKYAAIILESSNIGSGHFYELEIMKNDNGSYKYLASEYLGDRVEIYSLKIENKTILIDMLYYDISDALCCPTLKKIARYELSDY